MARARRVWTRGVGLLGVGALAMAAGACSSDSGDDSGSGGNGGSGGDLARCTPTQSVCYVGDGPTSVGGECLARADNTGADAIEMRVMQLQATAPDVLSQPFMQDAVITKRITFDQPDCYQYGDGQFSILFSYDTTTKQLTVGGAPPQALVGDPVESGTCFVDFTDPSSQLAVKPVSAELVDGKATYTEPVILPIYLENVADNYVLLPINELEITADFETNPNCIGRHNAEALDPGLKCGAPEGALAWQNGGKFDGYITVADADEVSVVSLGQTLCVVLSGDKNRWSGTKNSLGASTCVDSEGYTQTGGLPEGDWCAATNSPRTADCADAWRLETEFAAAAIDIRGTWDTSTNGCSG